MTVLPSEKSVCVLKGLLYLDLPLFKMRLFCCDSTQNFGKALAANACGLQRGENYEAAL